jgi:Family of unknown function (DUF6491)
MIRTSASLAALAAAFTALPAPAAPKPAAAIGDETYIPFPESGIRSWHADDDRTLWVIDHRRRWYRVDLMRPCVGLPYAYALHFATRGTGRFDRTSAIAYQGQRCPVKSVVRSDPPETAKERREAARAR